VSLVGCQAARGFDVHDADNEQRLAEATETGSQDQVIERLPVRPFFRPE
jgi:hypothetical protein